jgi:phosphatidylserine/phosphatidylglycerophosphate/cardiolipin synthase-like enzyme
MDKWQPTTLHAKTFVIDGERSTIGSINFDNRSMALNEEATLMVLDRTVGEQMNRMFLTTCDTPRRLRSSCSVKARGFSGWLSGVRT